MIQRWRRGERPLPEEFLGRHPGLWQHPEAAADLIYEELCLRQEFGPEVPVEQVLHRFPQWRPQLEVLFDCQRVLGPRRPAPLFPSVGETRGDFLLLAELGSGAQGRVFLAQQRCLGDRPVVLKLTPAEAREHLALARLQHTHIVPLYSIQDHAGRGLRALCMPYFGGATLDRVLAALPAPPGRRTGQDLLDALDRTQAGGPVIAPARVPARRLLARSTYVQAVCWIGACLADALQHAHERGLVHLDLKPANVLLAADGEPMLLDFHLAREPVSRGGEWPEWLGGTPGYMSPEQEASLRAIEQGRPAPQPVDGRSDIYSLGVVLHEALAVSLPAPASTAQSLHRCHPQVSIGLADVVARCLACDPARRYPDMAALAADLRRHLRDLPLAGVRNRSLAERWHKWRRRRPYRIALACMMMAVVTAAAAVGLGAASHLVQRVDAARTALGDGQVEMAQEDWERAAATLQRGLSSVGGIPFQKTLAAELDGQLRRAEQGRAAAATAACANELHELAERVRFLYGADDLPGDPGRLVTSCRVLWENRDRVVERLGSPLAQDSHDDLLDLAIFWSDLQVRLAPCEGREEGNRRALRVLAQAQTLFGPSPVLDAERRLHGNTVCSAGCGAWELGPGASSPWKHYALGRAHLRSGDLEQAEEETERAVRLQPHGLWPNFYHGLAAYRRGRYADAVAAFSICIGAAPGAAGCFYNRGRAFAALGRTEQAQRDYDQAVRLDPTLAVAIRNR
jgi:serine/threonine protein kinase